MKTRYKLIFSALVLGLVLGMVPQVYAEENVTHIGLIGHIVAFGSFVVAGVFYSASGYAKAFRRKFAGESVDIDYEKLGKNVLLGIFLAVGAFIYSAYIGDIIQINTVAGFLGQAAANITAILFIDKWIIGRTERPQ